VISVLLALLAGFGVGASLIVAIGAQNAYVLRQGIRAEYVLPIVAICAASDAVLIAAGISGVGTVAGRAPVTLVVVRWVGATFLIGYGLLAARRTLSAQAMTVAGGGGRSLRAAVLTALAMTWLNPHVYLDTVFLLGSLAADRGDLRWTFGLGAALASLCWFAALGFGARLLGRYLAEPAAWRVLDGLVALTMIGLGLMLVAGS
jgi:L-lysine exporter family protein LysE/ArgO